MRHLHLHLHYPGRKTGRETARQPHQAMHTDGSLTRQGKRGPDPVREGVKARQVFSKGLRQAGRQVRQAHKETASHRHIKPCTQTVTSGRQAGIHQAVSQ
jgi:hypothetical protein